MEDDRDNFTRDDIREVIQAAAAQWRAEKPLKEAIKGAVADETCDSDAICLDPSFRTFRCSPGTTCCRATVNTKELLQASKQRSRICLER